MADILAILGAMAAGRNVTLSSTPAEVMALLSPLGFKDESLVEMFLTAARATTQNLDMTVQEFFKVGGLARILARQQKPEDPSSNDAIIECPHCQNMVCLYVDK